MAKNIKLNKSLLNLPNTLMKIFKKEDWIKVLYEEK